ncbi:trans-sulfuration enzyme family protein [Luteibaculum oceani]|uniref:PLP-dependent transferase n=1 Tax=Luteibaculum oceani TaxID=1294296 RepID=A0A5C6VPM2_9FLAO|nr:PLP-dependent aspartate aminotransferase family protein [Luteibaculum oceani]TXC85208.1 PLP-dependent transferase [Luteibaculum oceani]
MSTYKFGTKAIHSGVDPDPTTGAIMTPIYQTSTYVQEEIGSHKGYQYSRIQNPTRTALEKSLATVENGKYASCLGSGMAATDLVMRMLKPGDEVIAINGLYGGSYRIFKTVYEPLGIKFHFDPMVELDSIAQRINANTRLLWLETPTNPLLQIIDLQAICSLAKKHGIMVAVDNTFASPYLQNPLDLGADIVMHSVTKYLAGHSDVIMGALITNSEEIAEEIQRLRTTTGAVPGPQDCFLVLRGIKTLHLRMRQHCINAKAIAEYLNAHPKVEKVNWPGLPDHPNHEVAKKQMRDFGGMLSFSLVGDRMEDAKTILNNCKLFCLAESLGGVESLSSHPATMSHAALPKEERLKTGIVDSLIRLSVGVEDAEDLLKDLDNALSKI